MIRIFDITPLLSDEHGTEFLQEGRIDFTPEQSYPSPSQDCDLGLCQPSDYPSKSLRPGGKAEVEKQLCKNAYRGIAC